MIPATDTVASLFFKTTRPAVGLLLAGYLSAGSLLAAGKAAQSSAADSADEESLAVVGVMPFQNIENDKELEWLGSSLADSTEKSMSSLFRYRRSDKDEIKEIAADFRGEAITLVDQQDIADEAGLDLLISGRYIRLKGKDKTDSVLIRTDVYITDDNVLAGRLEKKIKVDNSLFKSAGLVAQEITKIIYEYYTNRMKKQAAAAKDGTQEEAPKTVNLATFFGKGNKSVSEADKQRLTASDSFFDTSELLNGDLLLGLGYRHSSGRGETVATPAPRIQAGYLVRLFDRRFKTGFLGSIAGSFSNSDSNTSFYLPSTAMLQASWYLYRYDRIRIEPFAAFGWSGGYISANENVFFSSLGAEAGLRVYFTISGYRAYVSLGTELFLDSSHPMASDNLTFGISQRL